MKFSLLTASLVALLPFALAEDAAAATNRAFKLRVPENGPSQIAGQFVKKNPNAAFPEYPYLDIGSDGAPWTAVIKGDSATHGEIVDAENPNAPLWLRPTHGTPFYFVRYGGNPLEDAVPALVHYKDWNINTVAPPNVKARRDDRHVLKYGDDTWQNAQWTACGGTDGKWNLYYVGRSEALNCVGNFDMEVVYV